MASLVKVSEAAAIGIHAMLILAARPDATHSTKTLAERLQVSEAHLSKVLQRLRRAGLVQPVRGPKGGFQLSRGTGETSLLKIYEVIEGPVSKQTCLLEKPICRQHCCLLGTLLQELDRVYVKLARTSLTEAASCIPAD